MRTCCASGLGSGLLTRNRSFPGHGQAQPEQLKIEKLRREVAKLKVERDIPKIIAACCARDSI